jgi:hypothetical protein
VAGEAIQLACHQLAFAHAAYMVRQARYSGPAFIHSRHSRSVSNCPAALRFASDQIPSQRPLRQENPSSIFADEKEGSRWKMSHFPMEIVLYMCQQDVAWKSARIVSRASDAELNGPESGSCREPVNGS